MPHAICQEELNPLIFTQGQAVQKYCHACLATSGNYYKGLPYQGKSKIIHKVHVNTYVSHDTYGTIKNF